MMRLARLSTLVFTASFLSSCGSPPEPDANGAQSAGLDAADMLGYLESKIDIAEDKFIQLAERCQKSRTIGGRWRAYGRVGDLPPHRGGHWYGGALMDVPDPGGHSCNE